MIIAFDVYFFIICVRLGFRVYFRFLGRIYGINVIHLNKLQLFFRMKQFIEIFKVVTCSSFVFPFMKLAYR